MEYTDKEFCIEVWGDLACFTRPELKVERVSYDVITPSAARAIFDAILFKRYAMRWQITRIDVLSPIRWVATRRNEVGAVASRSPIYIEEKRQQRNTLMLRDVRYRLWARLVFIPVGKRNPHAFDHHAPGQDENPAKYQEMFVRRAKGGQCFTQPYLGTRECAAAFRLIDTEKETLEPAIADTRDLGIMLYDMDYEANATNPPAMFFRAKMENGTIIVPPKESKEVLK